MPRAAVEVLLGAGSVVHDVPAFLVLTAVLIARFLLSIFVWNRLVWRLIKTRVRHRRKDPGQTALVMSPADLLHETTHARALQLGIDPFWRTTPRSPR